jgi:Tol biopolymer transport system component
VNEEALSRAVNELRGLLGDDARTPQFIRTVPKRGYRLIASVRRVEGAKRSRRFAMAVVVGITLVLVGTTLFLWSQSAGPPPDLLTMARRLTADPGMEWQPEISTNGQWVAQVIARDGRAAIQVFSIATPEDKREIVHPNGLWSPVFSPDGSRLATLAGSGDDCRILIWPVVDDSPANAESAQPLGPCYRLTFLPGADWSADGNWLAYTTRDPDSGAVVLSRLRISDGKVEQLTHLADSYQSDERPRFSPDGRWLSFSRGTRGVRELWLLDLKGEDVEPQPITKDGQFTWGHDWWPDSRWIVMDSDRSGNRALWRVGLDGKVDLLGARDAQLPSVSGEGSILFQIAQYESNIWLLAADTGNIGAEPLIASTKYDSTPTWSPDGSEIAFSSNRTGDGGIWIASADGSRVRLVYAPEEGRAVGPAWIDEGAALLATEYVPGQQRIVRIALNRHEIVPLETLGSNPYAPSESPDREWIYYLGGADMGDREGGSQLWRMRSGDPTLQEVVLEGPLYWYQIGDDGFLYFTRYAEPGLWRRRLGDSGEAEPVLPEFPTWAGDDWSIHDGWVYHAADDGIYRLSLATEAVEKISDVMPGSLGPSIAVHPEGRTILVSKTDRAESDLFVAGKNEVNN